MKIAQINSGVDGSTGKIMLSIAEVAKDNGMQTFCASAILKSNKGKKEGDYYRIGNYYSRCLSVLLGRITGKNGCFAYNSTKKLIKKLEEFSPDIIHFHNLHDSYVNVPMLFEYVKSKGVKVVWTLHDCWAFTGHCAHYDMIGCDKWQTECKECKTYRSYPKSYVDTSKTMFTLKQKWFKGVEDLIIVTPSRWLKEQVEKSFLKDYPIKVINNGIDLSVFKPTESNFRENYMLQDKSIILGVAFGWGKRKGLDVFVELSKRLGDEFKVVLVGVDEKTKQSLPTNILALERTNGQKELAEIYSSADVFVIPTREDTFPTVNIEALACGTPVVTFKTGGSPEILDESCGSIVEKEDVEGLINEIKDIVLTGKFSRENCVKRASAFNKNDKFAEYVQLYRDLCKE